MVRQTKTAPGRDRPCHCDHPKCEWGFPTNSDLKRHKLSHLPREQRAIVCPVSGCTSRFNQTQELKQHMRKHGPKPVCELCNQAFSNMFRHKKEKHGYVPKQTDRSHFPEKPPNKSRRGSASSAAAVKHRAASIMSTTSAVSLGTPTLSSPSSKAGTWNDTTLPSTSPISTSSTYTSAPAASPTPSSCYSPQYLRMSPSSLFDTMPFSASYASEPLRSGASCLTSRNVQRHDEKSSPILYSPYSRAWSSRHKKASSPRPLSSSSPSLSSSHFTGLTTPLDSPAASPEVVSPSMSTSSDPTFHFGYPTDAAWNQEVSCDTYGTGGDVIIAKPQDALNAHFKCEIPTYDTGAVQLAQQEVFQGYHYPAQQLPISTAPMGMGYDVCMDPFTGYVEYADTVAASPSQLQIDQQLLTSMTQVAMEHSVYSSLPAEYIDMFAVPLDQPQAEPQLELDYSDFNEWSLESEAPFMANFNYALATCHFDCESMVPTTFNGLDGRWMDGTQFASY